MLRNVLANYSGRYNNSFSRRTWRLYAENPEEMEDFMVGRLWLARDEFIFAMHAANSSRKWRLLIKMQKWKNPISFC